MNIFFLDSDHSINSQYHVDKHVVKMPLEASQIMATAYPKGVAPYKHTHFNHPMAKWARETRGNFLFVLQYASSLCKEYSFRYEKRHKCEDVVEWHMNNIPNFSLLEQTDPPRCFGDFQIKLTSSVVEDYRNYYLTAKKHIFNWKNRSTPEWIF